MAKKKKWFHVEIYLTGGASFDCVFQGETIKEARRQIGLLMDRTTALGESFTAEQLRKIFDLGLKAQPGKRRDVTWWVHWENGVIRSYGQDLDRVKEQAEQEAKENGMEYFIT